MNKRFLRDKWSARSPLRIKEGDYVVATKYADGDPADHFCIGFYDGSFRHFSETRHLVVDGEGKQFRNNGFRRVAKVSVERGTWMVEHLALIKRMGHRFGVWHWLRQPMWVLRHFDIAADREQPNVVP